MATQKKEVTKELALRHPPDESHGCLASDFFPHHSKRKTVVFLRHNGVNRKAVCWPCRPPRGGDFPGLSLLSLTAPGERRRDRGQPLASGLRLLGGSKKSRREGPQKAVERKHYEARRRVSLERDTDVGEKDGCWPGFGKGTWSLSPWLNP